MAPEPILELRAIRTSFGGNLVHDELDLTVRRGEVMALVGGSGTGKSVLMRHMIGLTRPAAGTVNLFGQNIARAEGWRRRIGVLFQDGALFSSLTVCQNIQLPLKEHCGLRRHLLEELSGVKISLSGLPRDAAGKYPSELSGGMRKRAGLARALALDPEMLFLDEPTAGLDPIGAAAFDELIRSLQQSLGLTVVMITHDLDSLVKISDRIAVLLDRKTTVGTFAELCANPHPWLQSYFAGPRARAADRARTPSESTR